jgi:hypothetical protein
MISDPPLRSRLLTTTSPSVSIRKSPVTVVQSSGNVDELKSPTHTPGANGGGDAGGDAGGGDWQTARPGKTKTQRMQRMSDAAALRGMRRVVRRGGLVATTYDGSRWTMGAGGIEEGRGGGRETVRREARQSCGRARGGAEVGDRRCGRRGGWRRQQESRRGRRRHANKS